MWPLVFLWIFRQQNYQTNHKSSRLMTYKISSFFRVFSFFRRGICLMTPFVGMNFSRFIIFFFWGGGDTFCGKDEGEWKGFGPIGSIFRGIHVGNPCKMDPNARLLKCSLPKTKWFSPENKPLPKSKVVSQSQHFSGADWFMSFSGSVSFQIAGCFGLYSRKYFGESRSPKEGWKHVRQARHKKIWNAAFWSCQIKISFTRKRFWWCMKRIVLTRIGLNHWQIQ